MKIIIEKELEEGWKIDIEDLMKNFTNQKNFESALIELAFEDMADFLDGATWKIIK